MAASGEGGYNAGLKAFLFLGLVMEAEEQGLRAKEFRLPRNMRSRSSDIFLQRWGRATAVKVEKKNFFDGS